MPKWRYETLLELITKNDYQSYVEIGLGHGTTMKYLMDNIKNKDFVFYGIDPFERYKGLHRRGLAHPESSFENNKKEVLGSLTDDRFVFCEEYSHDAADTFESESIDLVFIDGNHTFKYVKQDIEDWYPVVSQGGILAGHDYYPPGRTHHYRQVGKAVDQFCKKNDIKLLTAPDHVWYFYKK